MDKYNQSEISFSLTESNAQMNDFFYQTSLGMAIIEGPEHFFSNANSQYEILVGRKVVGKKVSDIFTVEELGPYLDLVKYVYKTGIVWSGKEQPFKIPNRAGIIEEHRLDIAYYPMRDSKRIITGVLAVVIDVTDQFKAKKIINENANALPHIFWSARPDGFVDWYDDKFYSYTGMKRGAFWNDSETPLHVDDLASITRLWTESISTGKIFEINLRLKSVLDGEYHWFLSRAMPVRDELGSISRWIGTLTDVHENRTFLSQLQIEREMREVFVATLSHDLRSPLVVAKMSADLLMRNIDKPEFFEKYLISIIKNLDRADQMIRDLLDAKMIKAGEFLPISIQECDLGQIALEVVEELRGSYGNRFELKAPTQLKGEWSHDGLRRILENLLSNAIKYGSEKLPVVLSLSQHNHSVLIEVHNSGNPIPSEDQATLFHQYRRSSGAGSSQQRGWGLGLTLVKGIAEAHYGNVTVLSSLEAGTTFSVTLPRSRN